MQININVEGVETLNKTFDKIIKKQTPFAKKVAINETAFQIKTGVERQIVKDIDRPTNFTKRAVAVKKARSKNEPTALVFIKPIQANYLKYQVYGGKRKATKRKPVLVPSKEFKPNKYGNLPRNQPPTYHQPRIPSSFFHPPSRCHTFYRNLEQGN